MKVITEITREIYIEASPQRVWQALIDPNERNLWETTSCEMDVRVDGEVYFDYGYNNPYSAVITEVVDQQSLSIRGEDDSLTIWSIQAKGTGTRVFVTYQGLWMDDLGHMIVENMSFGTDQFLQNLKSVIEVNKDLRDTFWLSWIGITHTSIRPEHQEQYGVSTGSIVLHVLNGPSQGILHPGDVITAANEQPIHTYYDLELLVSQSEPDQDMKLQVIRNKVDQQVTVKLLSYPYTG